MNADEGSLGVTLHMPGNGGWQWDPLEQRNGVSFPGLTVAYSVRNNNALSNKETGSQNLQVVGDHPIHSLLVTLNETESFQAATASGKLLATVYLDYTLVDVVPGELVPWTRVYYDHLPDAAGALVLNVKVDGGLKLSQAIRNTVFGLTYESKNLTGLNHEADSTDPYHGFYGLGLVEVWAEISL